MIAICFMWAAIGVSVVTALVLTRSPFCLLGLLIGTLVGWSSGEGSEEHVEERVDDPKKD